MKDSHFKFHYLPIWRAKTFARLSGLQYFLLNSFSFLFSIDHRLLLANKNSKQFYLWLIKYPLWLRHYYQTCYLNITQILNFFSYLYLADQRERVHKLHLNRLHHIAIWHSYTNKKLRHLLDIWILPEGLKLSFRHSTEVWIISLSKNCIT